MVEVWCGGCLVWWMSFFAHGEVDVCVVDVVQSAFYLSKVTVYILGGDCKRAFCLIAIYAVSFWQNRGNN